MRRFLRCVWVAVALAGAGAGVPRPAAADSADRVSVYVVLEGEPAARAHVREARHGRDAARQAARRRERDLDAQHARFRGQLQGRGIEETGRFRRLANALRLRVPADQLAELAALPEVVRVERARVHYPTLGSSLDYTGVPAVWTAAVPGVDGGGVRIGIIDSGIDYTHADFGGPGTREAYLQNDPTHIDDGGFPTAKVVGGWDFAGDDYGYGLLPRPDPDPLDTSMGHGTFVAGVAAGLGVLADGSTWTGPYTGPVAQQGFRIAPGVAPGAQLYALKVFGESGGTDLVADALEWAADPDGDGDYADRLDVVNISIGSAFAVDSEGMLEFDQVEALGALGCVVVNSAGNEGNTYYVGGTPRGAVMVGACIDALAFNAAVEVLAPAGSEAMLPAVEAAFSPPLAAQGPVVGTVVYADPPLACDDLVNAAEVAGRIALVDRGICVFTEKVRRVQEAGAIAVIVANQLEGPPSTMGGDDDDLVIPAVMVSRPDGERLKTLLQAGLTVRVASAESTESLAYAGLVADFSSRGPNGPDSAMGPDLVAPGQDIVSAMVGTGAGTDRGQGTSYSAPHVTGAAALLRQLHPDWTAEDVRAALVNSAAPMADGEGHPYPESLVGSGRLRVDAAARLPVTARAVAPAGDVAVSLGARTFVEPGQGIFEIRVDNHAATPYQLDLSVQETISQPGFSLGPEARSVLVAPFATVHARFAWSARPALFTRAPDAVTPADSRGYACHLLPEASGAVLLTHPEFQLRVPYHVVPRAGATYRSVNPLLPVTPGSGPAVVTVPLGGISAHPAPLVSAFQLLHESSNLGREDPVQAMADLEAVGFACRPGARAEDAMIYFGIACRRAWTTPIRFLKSVTVEIDSVGGEAVDYRLHNATEAALDEGDLYDKSVHNNVHLAVLESNSDDTVVTGSYLNVFSPADRDTAVYNSRVMVMAVRAGDLGLFDANTAFRFRVYTYGQQVEDFPRVDATPWLPCDVAAPVIDTCRGLEGTPLYTDGNTLEVGLDTDRLDELPYPPALLLLHHMNTEEAMVDVVRLGSEAIHYVSPAGSATPPYTSWATAAHTIQDALDAAADGHLVRVTNGVYATGGAPAAGLFTRAAITNRVTVRSVNGAEHTVLEGGGELGPSAVRGAYLGDGASLVGFTVRDGRTHTNEAPAYCGGGVYLDHGGTLEDCTVEGCAANRGGGIYFDGQGTAWHCLIRNNTAETSGGGVRINGGGAVYGSTVVSNRAEYGGGVRIQNHGWLVSSVVTGNVATSSGGGADLAYGGWCDDCTFAGNDSPWGGGVRSLIGGDLDDCTLVGNTASSGGGGAFIYQSGEYRNCRFAENDSPYGGGARLREGGTLSGCDLRGNTASSNGGGVLVVDGGMVTDCRVYENQAGWGGGVLIQNTGTVHGCLLEGNRADSAGGGAYLWAGGEVTDSRFRDNGSDYGGGVRLQEGGLVERCRLSDNRADTAGGGVDVNTMGIVRGSVIYHNHAPYGGGVRLRLGGNLQSSTVVDNTADWGGGLYAYEGGTTENCLLYWNQAVDGGAEHYEVNAGAAFAACCTTPVPAGSGNFDEPPLLARRPARNYRPTAGSPLIDRAIPQDWMTGATDLDGTERVIGAVADIGAYEYDWTDTDGDSLTDMDERHVHGTSPTRPDSDFDGSPDNAELLAGTDPLDRTSVLALTGIQRDGPTALSLRWSSVAGRTYCIQASPDPAGAFSLLATSLPATPPENSRVLPIPAGAACRVFRVSLDESAP